MAAVSSGSAKLVDARPPSSTRRDPPSGGEASGTLKVPSMLSTRAGSSPDDDLRVRRRGAPDRRDDAARSRPRHDLVCNTGTGPATNWFAMSEVLGQNNVKLYAGSMVDWTRRRRAADGQCPEPFRATGDRLAALGDRTFTDALMRRFPVAASRPRLFSCSCGRCRYGRRRCSRSASDGAALAGARFGFTTAAQPGRRARSARGRGAGDPLGLAALGSMPLLAQFPS